MRRANAPTVADLTGFTVAVGLDGEYTHYADIVTHGHRTTKAGYTVTVASIDAGLSGASYTWSGAVPTGCILLGVTAKVKTAISLASGGTMVRVGDGITAARWGTLPALTIGSETSPNLYTDTSVPIIGSAKNVLVTPNSGTFSAGVVTLSAIYYSLIP